MSKRALFTLIVAASAIPSFSTGGTMEALVGIQPEVVQEIQAAQRSLEDGQFDLAAAQANLILRSRPLRVRTAEIRVRTHNPWARGMSFEQMRHEVAHELGHVLGLDDSRRLGAVMSPLDLRRPVGKVGDDELEALHRLRDLAAEVRREALEYAMRV
ncbi:MAG: hypothetical protein HY248_05010 [Fimbriimonas ginsengisoli]|nr:hypothetical protein [Fimbriimonas ginsengisoli]